MYVYTLTLSPLLPIKGSGYNNNWATNHRTKCLFNSNLVLWPAIDKLYSFVIALLNKRKTTVDTYFQKVQIYTIDIHSRQLPVFA